MAAPTVLGLASTEIEKAGVYCNAWGNCWQTHPYYGGYGGYHRGGGDWDGDVRRRVLEKPTLI